MKKHNVFIVHGIGTQSEGYTDQFKINIKKKLLNYVPAKAIRLIEIRYSNIIDNEIKRFTIEENANSKLKSDGFREIFNTVGYDAIAYGYKKGRILKYIHSVVSKHSEGCDNSFIAHSLGGIVIYDFLRKYKFKVKNLFTMGTPLALRLINSRKTVKPEFWLNIVGSHDIIGKPLKTDFLNIKQCHYDYIVHIGSFGIRKTPLSHTGYWDDDNAIKPIAQKLILDYKKKFNLKKFLLWIDDLWDV